MAQVRLNGWQRLWVVACFFIGIAWVLFGAGKITTQRDLDNDFGQVKDSYAERQRDIERGVPVTSSYWDRTNGAKTIPELWQGLRKEQDEYRAKSNALGMQQLKQFSAFGAAWAISCGVLYLAGWTVNWVYRGFRPKRVQP